MTTKLTTEILAKHHTAVHPVAYNDWNKMEIIGCPPDNSWQNIWYMYLYKKFRLSTQYFKLSAGFFAVSDNVLTTNTGIYDLGHFIFRWKMSDQVVLQAQ